MSSLPAFLRPATTACALTLAAAGLLASGCSMNPLGTHTPTFSARLAGAAEVPPNTSAGAGTLEARLNKQTQVLTWKVTYSGLTGPVTAAHFHGPAPAGRNAGVALPFAGPLTSPIEGQATLSAVQLADLLAGNWYVNLHTAAHPGGEVRGQLTVN